jgi:hypothetical protein
MTNPDATQATDSEYHHHHHRRSNAGALILRALVVAGLAVNAYIHITLAPGRPPAPPGGGLSQVVLFYAQGAAAVVAALLVLLFTLRFSFSTRRDARRVRLGMPGGVHGRPHRAFRVRVSQRPNR